MALMTRVEFAEICGVSYPHLAVYIKRGKVIEEKFKGHKKKKIDTENLYNKDFYEKNKNKNSGSVPEKKKKVAQKSEVVKSDPEPSTSVGDSGYNLDQKKKQRDIELKELSIEQKRLEIDKTKGKLIPKDLVQRMISQLSQSFLQTYMEKSELFVIEVGHKNKLSADARAELKGQMIDMINNAHKNSIEEAKSEFRSIVGITKKEYGSDE